MFYYLNIPLNAESQMLPPWKVFCRWEKDFNKCLFSATNASQVVELAHDFASDIMFCFYEFPCISFQWYND